MKPVGKRLVALDVFCTVGGAVLLVWGLMSFDSYTGFGDNPTYWYPESFKAVAALGAAMLATGTLIRRWRKR